MGLDYPERFRRLVLETIRHRELFQDGKILAAVSGGGDSTCLLLVLHSLQEKLAFQLGAAHIHHGLRGSEADGDAESVQRLADRLNLPCVVEKIDLAAVVEGAGNVEDAARHGRYGALATIARTGGYGAVATGHTLNDQAETVLHRMIRSSGPSGLRGVRPSLELLGARFVRPLIDRSRIEVVQYLESLQQRWREDSSNRDPTSARNRLRHRVFPELRLINSGVESAFARLADIVTADEEFFAHAVQERAEEMVRDVDGVLEMDVHELRSLPKALRWRLWRWVLERLVSCETSKDELTPRVLLRFEQIKQLERLVLGQEGRGTLHLRAGITVERIRGYVRASRES